MLLFYVLVFWLQGSGILAPNQGTALKCGILAFWTQLGSPSPSSSVQNPDGGHAVIPSFRGGNSGHREQKLMILFPNLLVVVPSPFSKCSWNERQASVNTCSHCDKMYSSLGWAWHQALRRPLGSHVSRVILHQTQAFPRACICSQFFPRDEVGPR